MSRTITGQPTVLVDMDGVLADWTAGVFDKMRSIAQETGYLGILPTPSQLVSFNVEECFTGQQLALFKQAMHSPGLYRALKPIPGGFEALAGLEAAGVHVKLCTSPDLENPTCADDKLAWVAWYGGRKLAGDTVITKDKTSVRGHLLVDDKPSITGSFAPQWAQVLFTQPYNTHVSLPRLHTWADWSLLLELLDLPMPSRVGGSAA